MLTISSGSMSETWLLSPSVGMYGSSSQEMRRNDRNNIIRIMSTQKIQTIKLPTDKKVMHLRKPSTPINEVRQIYDATNCKHTIQAVKKYVVYH